MKSRCPFTVSLPLTMLLALATASGCAGGGDETPTNGRDGDGSGGTGGGGTGGGDGAGGGDGDGANLVTMGLPAPANDCSVVVSITCLHFTGDIDGAPISGTCDTIGAGVSGSGSMRCRAEVQGDAEPQFEFNVNLSDRFSPPPGELDITLGPEDTNVIGFTWAPTGFASNEGGYQLGETHEISGQLEGTNVLDEGSSSPRQIVSGQAGIRWTPQDDCTQNCQDVRLRIEFGFNHPYSE